MKLFISLAFLALLTISPHAFADDTKADLTIVQGSNKKIVTENDFQKLSISSIEVEDPVYNKRKHYTGYWLTDILKIAGAKLDPNTTLTFTALDGYKASITAADMINSGAKAFVAVADIDQEEGWEQIQHGKDFISPGPYYLVWQIPPTGINSNIQLPWPYQMIEISIDKADGTQDKLFPESNDKTSSITHGYKIFIQNCLACHSLNLQGGTVGPELNVPQNITEYENIEFLKKFISDPSSFRAKSKMPSFKDNLSDEDLNDVLKYLAWMGKHKL